MSESTKTAVEQRVDELSEELSVAANEYYEARRYHDDAVARWDSAQYMFNVTRANLEVYLAGLAEDASNL